ncbi:hypothetical protein Bca4012_033198 [Brassica carinata]
MAKSIWFDQISSCPRRHCPTRRLFLLRSCSCLRLWKHRSHKHVTNLAYFVYWIHGFKSVSLCLVFSSRIFLLGPSHHYYTPRCALSTATVYKTPIGDLPVDVEMIKEIRAMGKFEMMDLRVDEAEHSMEMHLPYLAKVFQGHNVKVVPILVGSVSAASEAMYGELLARYVDDPKNFFSVSSDFCHWGSRFNYVRYDKSHGPIHKSIEALDQMGMDIIETGDPDAFKKYLLEFDNTICGRHPISIFLHMLKHCSSKIKINFLRYEQSSQCQTMRDSSVSYASAAAKLES